ncbi:hypothetical protein EV426DRAFT_578503 [Tirmania nivea]|nr:hypothetical protein EV426DRAFT_578503 [Tirmania nivea]
MPAQVTQPTPSRRHIREELSCLTDSVQVTANSITRVRDKLRPRAMNPSTTAPASLAGLIAEARAYEKTFCDLSELLRELQQQTADLCSSLKLRELRGKPTKRPWWRPKFLWDAALELDIAIHCARVTILERRLEELRELWTEVEMDVRRRSAHLYMKMPAPLRLIGDVGNIHFCLVVYWSEVLYVWLATGGQLLPLVIVLGKAVIKAFTSHHAEVKLGGTRKPV